MDRTTEVNTPEESALLHDFGSILETGGTTLTIVPEIQRMKFAKNIWNVVFASFATLTKYGVLSFVLSLLRFLKWSQQHSPSNIPSAS